MVWNIVVDSSCDLKTLPAKVGEHEIRYTSIPFTINIGGVEYVDDGSIEMDEFLTRMETTKEGGKSACPSPSAFMEAFEQEGPVIAVTISKELSGSYNSACAAKQMVQEEDPDKKIMVINSISASAGLILLVRAALRGIEAGKTFEEIEVLMEHERHGLRTIFSLCSFDNLIKNGRMSPIIGFIASKMRLWGIALGSEIGTIIMKGKAMGAKRAMLAIAKDAVEQNRKIRHMYICHCQNPEIAEMLRLEVLSRFDDIKIEIYDTTGLCSFYAERHGIIVAYD